MWKYSAVVPQLLERYASIMLCYYSCQRDVQIQCCGASAVREMCRYSAVVLQLLERCARIILWYHSCTNMYKYSATVLESGRNPHCIVFFNIMVTYFSIWVSLFVSASMSLYERGKGTTLQMKNEYFCFLQEQWGFADRWDEQHSLLLIR